MGRKAERTPDFIALAGSLWKKKKGPTGRVSNDGLKAIGDELDSHKFIPPAKYLEEKAAKELKARNRANANWKEWWSDSDVGVRSDKCGLTKSENSEAVFQSLGQASAPALNG